MKPNVFTIFTGDAKTMPLKAIYQDSLDPFDLTSCTEIDVSLPKNGGGFSNLKLSDGKVVIGTPAVLGKFSVTIETAVSDLLNIGELQNFDVVFTIAGKEQTVRYIQALSVLERDPAA